MAGHDNNTTETNDTSTNQEIDPTEETEGSDVDVREEYDFLDSKLDELNQALDFLEQKNDDIHEKLKELLQSSIEIRQEIKNENSGVSSTSE